jgi:hypothetical protein
MDLEVEHVRPVQLLVVGHDEGLAVAFEAVSLLRAFLLGFQRLLEEPGHVAHQVPDHLIRNAMVDELHLIYGSHTFAPIISLRKVGCIPGRSPSRGMQMPAWRTPPPMTARRATCGDR